MKARLLYYWRQPWCKSILLHGGLLVILCWQWALPAKIDTRQDNPSPGVIHAVAVSESQLVKAMQARKAAQEKSLREAALRKKRAAAIKAKKMRQAAAKRRELARAKKRQQAKAAAKKQAAAEHLARLKQAKLKAKQAAAKQANSHAKKLVKQAQAVAQRRFGLLNKYQTLIIESIERHWLIPEDIDKQLSCRLRVRLASGGVVVDVNLVRSSGSHLLDRSAIAAVHKASPLPVPSDPELFEKFKELDLTVHPSEVMG